MRFIVSVLLLLVSSTSNVFANQRATTTTDDHHQAGVQNDERRSDMTKVKECKDENDPAFGFFKVEGVSGHFTKEVANRVASQMDAAPAAENEQAGTSNDGVKPDSKDGATCPSCGHRFSLDMSVSLSKATEQAIKDAHAEADRIVSDGEKKADDIIAKATEEATKVKAEATKNAAKPEPEKTA